MALAMNRDSSIDLSALVYFGYGHDAPSSVYFLESMLRQYGLWGLVCASTIISAFGQSNFATLSGSVTDEQGRAISDVQVEVRGKSTGLARTAMSNTDG